MPQTRKIIVHIATSADGYIARLDGTLDWLTRRPAPKGFYGLDIRATRASTVKKNG